MFASRTERGKSAMTTDSLAGRRILVVEDNKIGRAHV